MSTEANYSEELLLLAETLGEVKTRTERLEAEFATNAKPIENATGALAAALAGIKALQFHVVDNNLGALSARVEEMRKAVDEQVGVIALELKKADETNAAKAGAEAEALRSEIVALQSQLGSLVTQFGQQLERVEFAAKEEAKKLQLIPGPAGASLNPRGVFIDGETYNRLDVVSWLGSSYIATVDGVTEKPSKNSNQWQVLASRGGNAGGASTLALTDVYGKPSNGQLLIGNGTDYVNATLTAGNGIAVTNGSGSITIEATGAVNYQGAWNALTNSPTLTSSVGTKGYYYVVSVAGSTNLNGITDWQAGDWAVFNGTAWEKIDNTDRVSSVFGRTGAVVGVSTDYSSVGITNTAIGASNPSTGAFTTLSATGNLTVNGTGSINGGSGSAAFAIKETASAGTALSLTNRNSTQTWGIAVDAAAIDDKLLAFISGGTVALSLNATNWNATFAGNLTVSGTGTSSVNGTLLITGTTNYTRIRRDDTVIDFTNAAQSAYADAQIVANNLYLKGNNGTGAYINASGNVLIGTTTDGGQKLQVAGTSLFSDALTISKAQAAAYTSLTIQNGNASGYSQLNMISGSNTASINYAPGVFFKISIPSADSFQVSTNNTTALTIDSSQNTTFAGKIRGTYLGVNANPQSGSLRGYFVESTAEGTPTFTGGEVIVVQRNAISAQACEMALIGGTASTCVYAFGDKDSANIGRISYDHSNNSLALVTNSATAATITSGGNVLVGTTTDSANGKIQLTSHTTSAGGIGFGTETSLYRGAGGNLCLNDTGTNAAFSLCNAGTKRADFYAQGSTSTLIIGPITAGWSTVLMSGAGTTALTLDSSQNATFAGNLTVNGTATSYFGGVANSYTDTRLGINTSNASVFALKVSNWTGSATTNAPRIAFDNSTFQTWSMGPVNGSTSFSIVAESGGVTALTSDSSGNITLAGSIKTVAPTGGTAKPWELGEAATVSPTSPNRTIRVEIDGTVYYLHAKTTND